MSDLSQDKPAVGRHGVLGLLTRLYWVSIGNFPLIFLPIFILQEKKGGFSLYDPPFLLAVLALLAVRYIDIVHFQGRTSENEPATMQHWKAYALKLSAISFGALLSAHVFAFVFAS